MLGKLLGRLMGGGESASFEQVKAASETGSAMLIDVREPGEFASGHIPGSVNMPLSRFSPDAVPKGRPVILICLSGARSARARSACTAVHGDNVSNFAPGVSGWRNQGGPLQRG